MKNSNWAWQTESCVNHWMIPLFKCVIVYSGKTLTVHSSSAWIQVPLTHTHTHIYHTVLLVWYNSILWNNLDLIKIPKVLVKSGSLKEWRLVKLCKMSTLTRQETKLVLTRTELPQQTHIHKHTQSHTPLPHEKQTVFSLEALLHCITRFRG